MGMSTASIFSSKQCWCTGTVYGATACFLAAVFLFCLGCSGTGSDNSAVMVNSLDDQANPPAGTVTLRLALSQVPTGGTITFAPSLDRGTILLSRVDTDSSVLKGEVFTMSQGRWVFQGYQERNYGRSALYAAKNVTIDASSLPGGITVSWAGDDANRARILAIYGNLIMKNVTLTGGFSSSEPLTGGSQPHTLARGGAVAVWGTATLEQCTLGGNCVSGDTEASRDRGAFGGGIYADLLILKGCVISGNSATGYGAAGGGVYSVGGVTLASQDSRGSSLDRCTVAGNSVTAQHAYGGGVYSDGGGPGSSRTLTLSNCTIARNRVQDHPGIAESSQAQYYYRGGGIYMSNGSLSLASCTVAENAVSGIPAMFRIRPNMGGGGIAATIGDAHVVESIRVRHSIIAGNSLSGAADDIYTGSLINFFSYGYNLVGTLDFSQILVPIPVYNSLSRRHWPMAGDQNAVLAADALDMGSVRRHDSIISVGTDAGEKALLWYPPATAAIDRIPSSSSIRFTFAEYSVLAGKTDDFLNHVITRIRSFYGNLLGNDFGADLGDLSGITCNASSTGWPSDPVNAQWIGFWREIERRIGNTLGPAQLADPFWGSFASGPLGANLIISVSSSPDWIVTLADRDQLGNVRPKHVLGDVGAIEASP